MTTANTGGSLIGKIGSYLQIVAKDPGSTAFVPLAEAYRQVGLLDDALEATRLGTKRLPHFSPGFSAMGRILGQMGRIDEAMSAYARALSIDRQSQAALVGLARLHLIRGERDQARKILAQAKEAHPGDDKISDMLIALDLPRPWDQIKQIPQVKSDVSTETVAAETGEPIPTATLAEIYVKQGLIDKAIKIYNDILMKDQGNSTARERIMQLKRGSGNEPQAGPGSEKEVAVEAKSRAPLAVMQRWLSVIKQGRANV